MWWVWWLLVAAFWWMMHASRLWEDGRKMEKTWWRSSSTSWNFIGIFVTSMPLTTTTTSDMHCHQFKIHGWQISGSVGYLLSFCSSQRLMYFRFYTNLSNVSYVGRECLRYWIFVGSWHGNSLIIYTLVNGSGGGEFLPDSIHWLMTAPRHVRRYQNWRWISTAKNAYQQYSCSFECGKI